MKSGTRDMTQEVELKLAIAKQDVDALLSHPLLQNFQRAHSKKSLKNHYYDTPDQLLTQSGFALRIRRSGDQYIQTLKGKGSNIAGLHQRLEMEWNIAEPELDLSLIPADMLPADLDLEQIQSLFTTNFERQLWLLDDGKNQVEVVLDQGEVATSDACDPICEIELELKQGSVESLFDLAKRLASVIPLVPSDTSKAERGYRLLSGTSELKVRDRDLKANESVESAFIALMSSDLSMLQRQWEGFHFSQNWSYLYDFRNSLANLHTNLDLFASIIPQNSCIELMRGITWLETQMTPILSWWPACFALSKQAKDEPKSVSEQLQQAKAWQALDKLEQLEQLPEFGLTLLNLSEWLHGCHWRNGQTPEQKEQANGQVEEILLNPLKQQWHSLNLQDCRGSVSSWLERQSAIEGLVSVCKRLGEVFDRTGNLNRELDQLQSNLSELSAMDVIGTLGDWLQRLSSEEKETVRSWARCQTVVVRDLNLAAQKLIASL